MVSSKHAIRTAAALLVVVVCIIPAAASEQGSAQIQADGSQQVGVQPSGSEVDGAHYVCDIKSRLKETVTAANILAENAVICNDTHTRHFSGETLAYVTPWNNKGYDMAKKHAGKFTYISPVWLQLRDKAGGVEITGTHDIDLGWIAAIRASCEAAGAVQCPSILPRIVWESRQFDKAALKAAIEAINTIVRKNKFDGIVLEAPLRQSLVPFYTSLGKTLHNSKSGKRLTLIAVLPPSVQLPGMPAEQGISPDTFKALAEHIDRFSLMTYDFSVHRGKSGPNAPIAWAKDIFKGFISSAVDEAERSRLASQILLGVPFYGYDNMDAIVGSKYLHILGEHQNTIAVRLDKHTSEHYATYAVKGQMHVVYYPSPYMLQQRLDMAAALGGGISIWEIGQGLDYFFDLF